MTLQFTCGYCESLNQFSMVAQLREQTPLNQAVQREPDCIQKPDSSIGSLTLNRHFFCYVLGGAGITSFIVSCVASMLIPAIGSVGVISIACLIKRKVTSLQADDLCSKANKPQEVFQKVLEQPSNQRSTHKPQIVSQKKVEEPLEGLLCSKTEHLTVSDLQQRPNAPSTSSSEKTSERTEGAISGTDNAMSFRDILLADIQKGKQLKKVQTNKKVSFEDVIKQIKICSPDLLNTELKATYERAKKICEGNKTFRKWDDYFSKKIDSLSEQQENIIEGQEQILKDIHEKMELSSLSENMKWIKSLLTALSGLPNLSNKQKAYYNKKIKSAAEHIVALEKLETRKIDPSSAKIEGRRFAMENSDSDSDSSAVDSEEEAWIE